MLIEVSNAWQTVGYFKPVARPAEAVLPEGYTMNGWLMIGGVVLVLVALATIYRQLSIRRGHILIPLFVLTAGFIVLLVGIAGPNVSFV